MWLALGAPVAFSAWPLVFVKCHHDLDATPQGMALRALREPASITAGSRPMEDSRDGELSQNLQNGTGEG